MLCLMKGRDEKGHPLERVDVVPEHKWRLGKEEFHVGEANKRADD